MYNLSESKLPEGPLQNQLPSKMLLGEQERQKASQTEDTKSS